MSIDEAIKHFGSQAELAKAIGRTSAAISMWKARGGEIPLDAQYRIQVASKGRLKAKQPERNTA